MTLKAMYGEGWDAECGTVTRHISEETAAARDAAGEWYTVVLREPGRRQPSAVLHIGWAYHYLGLWQYDKQGRRTLEADLRRPAEDRLLLAYVRRQQHDSLDDSPLLGGIRKKRPWLPVPDFGDWTALLAGVEDGAGSAGAPAARSATGLLGAVRRCARFLCGWVRTHMCRRTRSRGWSH